MWQLYVDAARSGEQVVSHVEFQLRLVQTTVSWRLFSHRTIVM